MQPADAAPAATESSAADRVGDEGRAGGATTGPLVPPPRSAPVGEGVAVPQPRSATEARTDDGTDPEPVVAATDPAARLTARERDILAFERQWWRHAGAKEQAIRDAFGLSATRYYQLLNALLDNPAALATEPVLVGRLRRLRSSRARNRRR